jgi:hypothetical protein
MRMLAALPVVLSGAVALAAPIAHWDAGADGFIDDGYALRDDGKAVAFITTDGATKATLHLVELGGPETKPETKPETRIEGVPIDATAIYWLGPARVLIVRSHEGVQTAQVFTAAGAGPSTLGPFGQLALAKVGGKQSIVTYTRADKNGVEHALVAYSVDNLRPAKKRSWREDSEGQIHQGSLVVRPLWWSDGFTTLVASRAGEFDKAHDIRRPDRSVKLDAFTGKVIEEQEVEDVMAFTRVGLLRREAPNQPVIVHWSEDRKQLLLLDGLVDRELTLPRQLGKYDAATLGFQVIDAQKVALSLTIDPVNPDAVKRQKADVDDLDFYAIDRKTLAPTLWLRLPGQQRRSDWRIVANRLLLLRKGKGFDRGGITLELYDLANAADAATAPH